MIGWFLATRMGRWAAMIGAGVALLAGAVLLGWTKRGQHEADRALRGYRDTRRRMDEVDENMGDDPAAARRWLSDRGRDGDL